VKLPLKEAIIKSHETRFALFNMKRVKYKKSAKVFVLKRPLSTTLSHEEIIIYLNEFL